MRLRNLTLAALAGIGLTETIVTKNTALSNCPPLGAVLPPPRAPSTNIAVKDAVAQLEGLQEEIQELVGNATALSLSIASAYEDGLIASLSYTPKIYNTSGTHKVDGDTVFRIASVSKVFNVLGLLLLDDKIKFSDQITKYVPELKNLKSQQKVHNSVTTVDWNAITIDSLASQLSGVGDGLAYDLANDPSTNLTQYGLPELNPDDYSGCGDLPSSLPCTWKDFWTKFGRRDPVYGPYTTPAYSDATYDILGLVIERVSGESYGDFIKNHIFKPLNMTHSYVSKPENDSIGFISNESNFWSTSMGIMQADGALYSSTNDLAKLGQAILKYQLIDETKTKAWLKPRSHTSSLGLSVGAPWEISRANNLTVDGRIIDVYSKIGDVPDYNSLFAVIPDYGLTLSLNSAGPESSLDIQLQLVSEVLKSVVRSFEVAGKAEASLAYAGTYSNNQTNSSITLSIDDQSGLHVQSWTMNGQDILNNYPVIASYKFGSVAEYISVRLFPTGLKSNDSSAWRAVYSTTPPASIPQYDSIFTLQAGCTSWETLDNLIYGYNALDDFTFGHDESDGTAISITPRAFRQTLTRN